MNRLNNSTQFNKRRTAHRQNCTQSKCVANKNKHIPTKYARRESSLGSNVVLVHSFVFFIQVHLGTSTS